MEKFLFLSPYIISLAISIWLTLYAWQHRKVQGADVYARYLFVQSLWILEYIFELLSEDLNSKIFWDATQWISFVGVTFIFPIFVVRYTEVKVPKLTFAFKLSQIIPAFFVLALFIAPFRSLFYPNPSLDHAYIFSELRYDFTWLTYAYSLYSEILTIFAIGILIKSLIRPVRLYRQQILSVTLGAIVPVIFSLLILAGVDFSLYRDISPFAFAIGNTIVTWGLFRYKIFDVVPIARELIFDNIKEIVIVLDSQDRIVDINKTALEALEMSSSEVIGQPVQQVYEAIPHILERFREPENFQVEIPLHRNKKLHYYSVRSTVLHDKKGNFTGRVFVATDISEYIEMQEKLKTLNDELEERVQQRTAELSQSMESYRAVVENQKEFIVRWRPDRSRTFVNEAYCQYFELSYEEALSIDFMTQILKEDRPAVNEKIRRLLVGEINTETEIHRVLKPDGTIGWQEWTDQVIRDAAGNVVEIQSVGRDITERKDAEDALTLSEEKFYKAFNTSPVLMTIEDDKGAFVDVNQAFLDAFGLAHKEAIGRRASDLNFIYSPDDLHRLGKIYREQGYLKNFEARVRKKNGEVSIVSLSSDDFYMNGIKHTVTSGLDIT